MLLILIVIYNFCGNFFISLDKHAWRCKSKHSQSPLADNVTIDNDSQENNSESQNSDHRNASHSDEIPIPNVETIKCSCGLRGLRAHQRTCRTFNDLRDLVEEKCWRTTYLSRSYSRVSLPTSKKDWELANAYFHSKLQVTELSEGNLDDVVNNCHVISSTRSLHHIMKFVRSLIEWKRKARQTLLIKFQ